MSPSSIQSRGRANFHRQLFILMSVRVIEPLSITQLFAYINPMMSHILPPTTDPADIGKYSGLIEAAFATGTFLTMYQWGRLSDRIGRKPAILSGLMGIALTTLAFGLSGNFYMALTARLLGACRIAYQSSAYMLKLNLGGQLRRSALRERFGHSSCPRGDHTA
jgi:MFS family permease